jgi:hypothetical protein
VLVEDVDALAIRAVDPEQPSADLIDLIGRALIRADLVPELPHQRLVPTKRRFS